MRVAGRKKAGVHAKTAKEQRRKEPTCFVLPASFLAASHLAGARTKEALYREAGTSLVIASKAH